MSWSDDIRCLYCDGKLPLYRKITKGQFCSDSHSEAYWQEQQRLAVERLHETHYSLRAYRPPAGVSIEDILGPPVQEAEPTPVQTEPAAAVQAEHVPEFGGLIALSLTSAFYPPAEVSREHLLAIETVPVMYRPSRTMQHREVRSLSMAHVDLSIRAQRIGAVKIALEASPLESIGGISVPLRSAQRIQRELMLADPMALALDGRILAVAAPGRRPVGDSIPLEYCVAQPLYPAYFAPLSTDEELQQLLDRRIPYAGTLLAIPRPAARAGTNRIARDSEMTALVTVDIPPQFTGIDARLHTGLAPTELLPGGRIPAAAPKRFVIADAAPLEYRVAQPLYPVYVAVSLKHEALRQIPDEQIPYSGKLLPIPRPAARAGTGRIAETITPIVVDLPPQFPADSASLHTLVPKRPGLSRLSIGGIPLVQGAWIDNLRAIESSNGQVPQFMLATPVSRPRLRQALRSHFPMVALESRVAAQADPQPAAFSTAPSGISRLPVDPLSQISAPGAGGLLPLKPGSDTGRPEIESFPAPLLSLPVPEPPSQNPMHPASKLEPLDGSESDAAPAVAAQILIQSRPWAQVKVWAMAVPLVVALSLYAALPKTSGSIPRALKTQFENVRRTVLDRAAVELNEDFRSGLDYWTGRDGAAADWSFDPAGFVRPGPLALYQPSVGLTDYQMQFLGMIDKKALSWVVRAADFRNYYAVKLVVLKAGPLPSLGMTRYAVVNGRTDSRVEKVVTLNARADTLYRVDMDMRGDSFLLTIQGQLVDNWSEPRLKRGGVGLFSAAGEASRVRWVQVLHQYDVLGRLCAYLAPYDFK